MTLAETVALIGVGFAILAVLSVWVAALYAAAVSFRGRWQSRFVDSPSPDWLRVFPRYAYRKVDWRLVVRVTALAALFGWLVGVWSALAVIGLGVVLS